MNFEKIATKKKINDIKSVPTRTTNKIGLLFLRLFVLAVILGMIVMAGAGLGVAKAVMDSAPVIESVDDFFPKGYTTFIYDQNGTMIQSLHTSESNRVYVEIDQIPKHMQHALVAIEDERFYQHNGIDVRGMIRALVVNIQAGRIREGASTITQQVIKNNVLTTDVTFERKLTEQYLALQLEELLDKDRILELYLNSAPFGRGTNGVQAAAKTYFNKDIQEITLAEAAVIAAITNLPTFYDPITNPENNRARQLDILSEMEKQGFITRGEYNLAINEPVYMNIQSNSIALTEQSDYSYFVDEVIKTVATDLRIQKGYTESQAYNLIYGGGLSIYVTQDLKMQSILDTAYLDESNFPTNSFAVRLMYTGSVQTPTGVVHHYDEEEYPTMEAAEARIEELKAEWAPEGSEMLSDRALFILQPQSAFVVMDYYTGHVKAMVGGRGEKIGNQTFNRATQALRQPGSTIKPIAVYLPAIDTYGYTLGKVIDDVPVELHIPGSATFKPINWYNRHDYNYWGLTTVKEGIKWSINVLAVKTLFEVGLDSAFDYLQDLGITTLVAADRSFAPLSLGGMTYGMTLMELTAAYGSFPNQGVYTEPIFYTRVLDHDGALLLRKEATQRRVMKETTAFLITDALKSVVTSGTGTATRFDGMALAGKTGTTDSNVDYVYIGYTPYYVAGVWIGYDMPKSMSTFSDHRVMWRNIMQEIHQDLEYRDFPVPNGIVQATVCTKSGKLVTDLCLSDPRGATTETFYFATGTVPTEACDVHVAANICTESELFATEFCPEDTVVQRVFTVRPEPLIRANWDPANPPRIRDAHYELPASTPEAYCDIHTIDYVDPELEEDEDDDDDDSANGENGETSPEDEPTPPENGNGNGNGNGNDNGNGNGNGN